MNVSIKFKIMVVASCAIGSLTIGVGLFAAAPASAASYSVEWYQFCAGQRAVPFTSANEGYMNAYWSPSGVTCQYWTQPWGFGYGPSIKYVYWSWTRVCQQYGYRSYYLDRGHYPVCTR